jgi:hypothetical protein
VVQKRILKLKYIKMFYSRLILLSIIVIFSALVACRKKGCTDSEAVNYDAKAKKEDGSCTYPEEPKLIVKFKFDSTQVRLGNFGQPVSVPSGNAAQSPVFHKISAHYVELAPTMYTQLGTGEIVYHGPETSIGGSTAVDFNQALVVGEGETFLSIPLKDIAPGTYQWLRVSLTYQNFDIKYRASGFNLTGRLGSFVGFITYITNYMLNAQSVTVNSNKSQGYWGFETVGQVFQGQAPATTVPNPLSATSPVPPGSCVVTGQFSPSFTITGNETRHIVLTISLSTNNSFEWEDINGNNVYEPSDGENVVDMGLRGLIPIVQ